MVLAMILTYQEAAYNQKKQPCEIAGAQSASFLQGNLAANAQ